MFYYIYRAAAAVLFSFIRQTRAYKWITSYTHSLFICQLLLLYRKLVVARSDKNGPPRHKAVVRWWWDFFLLLVRGSGTQKSMGKKAKDALPDIIHYGRSNARDEQSVANKGPLWLLPSSCLSSFLFCWSLKRQATASETTAYVNWKRLVFATLKLVEWKVDFKVQAPCERRNLFDWTSTRKWVGYEYLHAILKWKANKFCSLFSIVSHVADAAPNAIYKFFKCHSDINGFAAPLNLRLWIIADY